jgi:hypothetical protein
MYRMDAAVAAWFADALKLPQYAVKEHDELSGARCCM